MKASFALAFGVLAILAAVISFVLIEQRNADTASEMRARLDALAREGRDLRSEIAALKTGEISAEQRSAILEVIAADRADQKRQQSEDQQKRFVQLSAACADRAAQKYGLTEDQRKGLLEVVMMSREKLDAMQAQMIALRDAGDMDAIADAASRSFHELKAWRLDELTKRLGADVAQRVNEDELGLLGDAGRLEESRQGR
jgi:hypothetical protein